MPIQDFSVNTLPAAAGDMYGLATTYSQRLTYNTEAPMTAYGVAVQQGAKSNTIKAGAAAGVVLGITMRENKLEAAKRPSDGTIGIPVGYPLAVMLSGAINVKLKTAITGKAIGVSAAGEFGAVDVTYIACENVEALAWPAAAGDVIAVNIKQFVAKP